MAKETIKKKQTGINFADAFQYDPLTKKVISLRDGVMEYYGHEIGFEPPNKVFRVYRSPATVANCAAKLTDIPITIGHVDTDEPVQDPKGKVLSSDLIDHFEDSYASTVAVRNVVDIDSSANINPLKKDNELSLGYTGDLAIHEVYDFEQLDLKPHHLAIVPSSRCGAACSFIDKKGDRSMTVKNEKQCDCKTASAIKKAFGDGEGGINMKDAEQAFKKMSKDDLKKLFSMLKGMVESESENTETTDNEKEKVEKDTETKDGEKEKDGEDMKDEDKGKSKSFGDSKEFADAVAKAADARVQQHTAVIQKAQSFVDSNYSFEGKTTEQIMRDAIDSSGQDSTAFTDSELPIAFKMLAKQSRYQSFGDTSGAEVEDSLEAQIEKDLE